MKKMTRDEMALELRRIRRLALSSSSEAIEWLSCLLPSSQAVLRVRVKMLLATGRHEDVDATIAQGLLWRPDDSWLRLARAERLLERNRAAEAKEVASKILANNPECLRALVVAGRAEELAGRLEAAIDCYWQAWAIAPARNDLRQKIVSALLQSGRHDEAQRMLAEWPTAPAVIVVRANMACGRWIDACAKASAAIATGCSASERGELFELKLQILERLGRRTELRKLVESLDGESAPVLLRGAVSLLWLGDFTGAALLTHRLRWNRDVRPRALMVLAAAGALCRRPTLARRATHLLNREGEGFDRSWAQLVWRHGLFGRVLADQHDFSRAGKDASNSVLKPLIERSLACYERAVAEVDSSDNSVERIESHRSLCLRWLGRNENVRPIGRSKAA